LGEECRVEQRVLTAIEEAGLTADHDDIRLSVQTGRADGHAHTAGIHLAQAGTELLIQAGPGCQPGYSAPRTRRPSRTSRLGNTRSCIQPGVQFPRIAPA
jgi:hypothetical protein